MPVNIIVKAPSPVPLKVMLKTKPIKTLPKLFKDQARRRDRDLWNEYPCIQQFLLSQGINHTMLKTKDDIIKPVLISVTKKKWENLHIDSVGYIFIFVRHEQPNAPRPIFQSWTHLGGELYYQKLTCTRKNSNIIRTIERTYGCETETNCMLKRPTFPDNTYRVLLYGYYIFGTHRGVRGARYTR